MSSVNTRPTLLEHLPVEIFLQIFDFLPLQDLVTAFSGLNFYINSIIRSVTGISHVVKYDDVDAINLLQLFPTHIGRLVLFLSETMDFTSLTNVRSLTIRYGTSAQFDSIRPQYFPMLEMLHIHAMSGISSNDNTQTIHDLIQVILSNGFPRLRTCIVVRIGTVVSSETWTGSVALRYLHLDMKTAEDYEQLRSVCPNLRRFTSFGSPWINLSPEIYTGNLTKRLLSELQQTERLELQGTFILDVYPIAVFSNVKPPPRFNNTIPTPNLYSRGLPIIHGRILPQSKLYCRASFLIEITLPFEYPLKAFSLIFLDPIYHPSVDKFGRNRRSWGFRNSDMWTPRTSIAEVIEAVIGIIDGDLDVEYPDNDECAEEYRVAPQTFYEKAIRMTTSYGRPRY